MTRFAVEGTGRAFTVSGVFPYDLLSCGHMILRRFPETMTNAVTRECEWCGKGDKS